MLNFLHLMDGSDLYRCLHVRCMYYAVAHRPHSTVQYTENLQRTFSDNMGLHTSQVIETVCNKLSSIKCSKVDESGPLLGRDPLWFDSCNQLQSNLSNTDTEGTEQSVRIREVSV